MPVDLVEALKRNEASAFERLIAEHGAMLYRVALRLMGQREEAEDVLQEALLKVHQNIHSCVRWASSVDDLAVSHRC